MQLWRCLQAVKRKNADLNSSMEVIPFRESKLTHLLMPILGRAGLGGVAMIACVNPQGDDYDETLSILGNASIASKIREFADVGRVATQTVPNTNVVSVSSAPAPTAVVPNSKMIRLEELKDYKDKHGKDSDNHSTTSSTTAGTKRRRGDSTLGSKGLTATGGLKKTVSKSSVTAISATSSLDDDEENMSERKRLRREVEELKSMNNELLMQNIQRETEIREEISKEMMSRSTGLLNKISDLQDQLSAYETKSIGAGDVMTRSVKKAKLSNLSLENEDLIQQLQETEEEMERMKVEYEYELNKLKFENIKLKEEVNRLKGVNTSSNPVKKRKNSKQKSNDDNNENEIQEMNVVGKKSPAVVQSPSRSPLSQISTNSPKVYSTNNPGVARNPSPVKMNLVDPENNSNPYKGNSNNTNSSTKQSPQRLRTGGMAESATNKTTNNANGNNGGSYFTRLRSQVIRI